MLQLSSDIKLIVSDFDGVFTDGSVYISEKNEVQKKLNFKDIMGVSMLLKKGYNFAIISGEKSNIHYAPPKSLSILTWKGVAVRPFCACRGVGPYEKNAYLTFEGNSTRGHDNNIVLPSKSTLASAG